MTTPEQLMTISEIESLIDTLAASQDYVGFTAALSDKFASLDPNFKVNKTYFTKPSSKMYLPEKRTTTSSDIIAVRQEVERFFLAKQLEKYFLSCGVYSPKAADKKGRNYLSRWNDNPQKMLDDLRKIKAEKDRLNEIEERTYQEFSEKIDQLDRPCSGKFKDELIADCVKMIAISLKAAPNYVGLILKKNELSRFKRACMSFLGVFGIYQDHSIYTPKQLLELLKLASPAQLIAALKNPVNQQVFFGNKENEKDLQSLWHYLKSDRLNELKEIMKIAKFNEAFSIRSIIPSRGQDVMNKPVSRDVAQLPITRGAADHLAPHEPLIPIPNDGLLQVKMAQRTIPHPLFRIEGSLPTCGLHPVHSQDHSTADPAAQVIATDPLTVKIL